MRRVPAAHTTPNLQRLRGQYFTTGNPFAHPAFRAWWNDLQPGSPFLEPFAGADNIPALLRAANLNHPFDSFDIEPRAPHVVERDTVADFPIGYDTIVTNPPYLARHAARRQQLQVDHLPWGVYNNLYKVAIHACLDNASHVAAILPDSFVTSGLFRDRLRSVITLNTPMFADTTTPTCLALWGPEASPDFEVWRGTTLAGTFQHLASFAPTASPNEERLTFNRPDGQIGLRAIDTSVGPTIAFTPAAAIPARNVKSTARLVTRIHIDGLTPADVNRTIITANQNLNLYRNLTADVLMSAFKGLRKDGHVRRRIDYTTARRLLAHALP